MTDSFCVDHGGYGDVNQGLNASVGRMDTIMGDLNATLRNIGEASQGRATPLWVEQQNSWNQAYEQMRSLLGGHTQSSFKVADVFQEGDSNGARVMST
jgi:uncharacterized protein YukE